MKAIERKVGPYIFRSMTESFWGHALMMAGIKFDYECRLFETSEGLYLPDFYIKEFGMWAEVKPLSVEGPSLTEIVKLQSVSDQTGEVCVFLCGFPGSNIYSRNDGEGYARELDQCSLYFLFPDRKGTFEFSINEVFQHLSDDAKLLSSMLSSHVRNIDYSTTLDQLAIFDLVSSGSLSRYDYHDKVNRSKTAISSASSSKRIANIIDRAGAIESLDEFKNHSRILEPLKNDLLIGAGELAKALKYFKGCAA